jgi:spermidine synthase
VAAILVLLAVRAPSWDRKILTSGVTVYADRYEALPTDSLRLEEMRQDPILYYREGLTATISVHRLRKDYLYLKTNGKVDSSYGDALTMLMTGYVPMFLHPAAKDIAIIGLGAGMTAKAVAAFPVRGIEVLEIEPAMVEAAAYFKDKIGRILEDPRVKIVPTDGRNYMMAVPRLYDLIISEPSNPWIAGIASLFTREFYAITKRKLKPNGIFAQWIHNYSMSPDDFRMVLRTFGQSFPYVSVWNLKEADFLLIGSFIEPRFDYSVASKIFEGSKTIRDDFNVLGLSDVYSVLGFYRMGKRELTAFAGDADINTDDNVRLEFSAPRSLARPTTDLNRTLMQPFWVPPAPGALPRRVSAAQHHYLVGQAYRASSRNEHALKEVDDAVRLDPRNPDYHLLRAQLLAALDRPAEALEAAEKVLDYGRGSEKELLTLSEDLYTRQAQVIYRRLVERGSRIFRPYAALGEIALYNEDLKEAEKWFREAAKFGPKEPRLLLGLGKIESAKGNYAGAILFLEEAREKGEESASLYSTLADAYAKSKQWDKAAQEYRLALRLNRRNTAWRLALADALAQLGRVDEAETKYREVLALDPNAADAWKGLNRLGRRY